jgi:hypothetical protein
MLMEMYKVDSLVGSPNRIHIKMRITSFILAALAAPSALAAPVDLDIRQAKPRELSRSSSISQ